MNKKERRRNIKAARARSVQGIDHRVGNFREASSSIEEAGKLHHIHIMKKVRRYEPAVDWTKPTPKLKGDKTPSTQATHKPDRIYRLWNPNAKTPKGGIGYQRRKIDKGFRTL